MVLVDGMELPGKCIECRFFREIHANCAAGVWCGRGVSDGRADGCPLRPIGMVLEQLAASGAPPSCIEAYKEGLRRGFAAG